MRLPVITIAALLVAGCASLGQRATAGRPTAGNATAGNVTAGCATCIYGMKDVAGCKLAVRIDGQAYLVDGSGIDDHGDAHAADGLCMMQRDAIVKGRIRNGRFQAESIVLQPARP